MFSFLGKSKIEKEEEEKRKQILEEQKRIKKEKHDAKLRQMR